MNDLPELKETTLATPPLDVLKIMILRRRDAAMSELHEYRKRKGAGSYAPLHPFRTAVEMLFYELEPTMRRRLNKDGGEKFAQLQRAVFSDKFPEVLRAFREINEWLDEVNITRVDLRQYIDSTIIENESGHKGLD